MGDFDAFRYVCPDCDGAGELFVDHDPRDPASGHEVRCWVCGGDGDVTLADLEHADQLNAERCDDYTPPQRVLRPVTHDPEPSPPPTVDPWANPKDAA